MIIEQPKTSSEMIETQLEKIKAIELKVDEESKILDSAIAERVQTLSELIGKTWMAQTFPEKYAASIDPLLTKKFRTKVGFSVIRLEKLLLELDQIDTFGDEDLRARRRKDVKMVQELIQRAEELRKKANRLVDLQDSLATLGKDTMREVLEAPAQPAQSPVNKDEVKQKKRRFASPASSAKNSDAEENQTSSQRDEESMDVVVDTDSHEDLQEAQRKKNQMVDEYYKSIKSSKESMDIEKAKAKQVGQRDEAADEDAKSKSQEKQEKSQKPTNGNEHPKTKASSLRKSPVEEAHEDELPEPKMSVKELPRAYVILVQDPMIRRTRVSLDREENALVVAVPGKSPLTFRLGSNINKREITKEIQQDVMRIVLPKHAPADMRTGRPFGDAPFFPGFAMGDDLWSRF